MSRPLVALALAAFVVLGLAPIAVMTARVAPADLASLADERTLSLLRRTLTLGLGAAAIALAIGLPFGWLTARSDVPGAPLLRVLGLVPLLLPPFVLAMTWSMLVELRGAPMTILLLGAGTFPLVALLVGRAAERVDGRLEDAARLAGGRRAALRATLPLLLPGAAVGACLAFVFAINDFAVPDYVSSVGPKFNVYADEIFASWQIDHAEGRAVATALPLVLLTLAALVPALALRRRGALATLGGDFRRPEVVALGRWRWPAFAFCGLVLGLAALVPLGRLVFEAGGGSRGWSVEHVRAAFARALELCRRNLGASISYSSAAATLALPIAFVLGHAVERARHGRWFEGLAVLPIAVPAILFGVGEIALWNRPATADFYAGSGLAIALLAGRFLPFPLLVSSGAVAALHPSLEEAARLAGARPARRLAGIVAPALGPSIIAAWTLVYVLSMRELDAAILVPAANKTVMFRLFNAVHFGRDDFVAALALLVVFAIVLPGLLWSLFVRRRLEVLP